MRKVTPTLLPLELHTRLLLCVTALSISGQTSVLTAQSGDTTALPQRSYRIGLTVDAQGGRLQTSRATSFNTAMHGTQSSFLRTARAGVHTAWRAGVIEGDVAAYVASTSAFGTHGTRPLGLFRVATRRGPVTLSLGFEQSMGITSHTINAIRDTGGFNPEDTISKGPLGNNPFQQAIGNATNVVRASDIVGGLGWSNAISSIQLVGGVRANDLHAGAWGGADAALAVGRSNALTLSLRRYARATSIQTPAIALGFRSAYWRWGNGIPVSGSAQPARSAPTRPGAVVRTTVAGDTVRLHVLLPNARRVAVMGDATAWEAAEMTADARGWWHIALHIADGISRLQLRSDDGVWSPVPGLPSTRDEYGETVSLLVTMGAADDNN